MLGYGCGKYVIKIFLFFHRQRKSWSIPGTKISPNPQSTSYSLPCVFTQLQHFSYLSATRLVSISQLFAGFCTRCPMCWLKCLQNMQNFPGHETRESIA